MVETYLEIEKSTKSEIIFMVSSNKQNPYRRESRKNIFFQEASWCPLRDLDVESADHLFLACHIAVQIWNFIYQALHISLRRQGNQ